MKRLLTLAVCMIGVSIVTSAQLKFGAGVQVYDRFGVQGKVNNVFTEEISGQASFAYYFASGITFWGIDTDVHYFGLDLGNIESFAIAPLAGLNFARFSVIGGGFSVGLNLGIVGTLPLDNGLEVYVEPKIVIGGARSTEFAIGGGVYF